MAVRIDTDWLRRAETQAVFAALAIAGHEARAVGGAVRNALLGLGASDVDLATPAPPDAVMAAARLARLAVVPTGLKHGTVTILSGGLPYEVTTLRRDVETDGRHAVVAFTDDWAADASRRDFTINALYCAADGTVHDPLGGLPDLTARRVRFIGDAHARIREDYLRILRFFRFSANYAEAAIDQAGLSACGQLRAGLQSLSAERVRAELMRILVAPRADAVVRIMHAHGYWPALLGVVPWLPHFTARVTRDEASSDAVQRLAALAVWTPEDAARLATRLRLSTADASRLSAMAALAPDVARAGDTLDVPLALYRHGHQTVRDAIALAEARHGGDWSRRRAEVNSTARPVLPVRGQDLLDHGIGAGPAVGAALRDLEAQWIASGFALSRDALLSKSRQP